MRGVSVDVDDEFDKSSAIAWDDDPERETAAADCALFFFFAAAASFDARAFFVIFVNSGRVSVELLLSLSSAKRLTFAALMPSGGDAGVSAAVFVYGYCAAVTASGGIVEALGFMPACESV